MPEARSRRLLSWLILVLSLAWIVRFFIQSPDELAVLRSVRPLHVAGLLALQIIYFFLNSLRYQLILEKGSGRAIGFWPWLRLFVVGRFLNTLVPQLGTVYRGVRLKSDHRVTYADYLGSFLAFAWIGGTVNLLVTAVTIWATGPALRLGELPAGSLVGGLALLTAAGPVLLDALVGRLRLRRPRAVWLHEKLSRVLEVAVRSFEDRRYAATILALSLAGVVPACLSMALGCLALGQRLGLAEVLVFYALLQLSSFLVITPGNLGVRELIFGLLGPELGITAGLAILLSALLRAANFIVLAGLAAPLGGAGALGDRSLRGRKPDRP